MMFSSRTQATNSSRIYEILPILLLVSLFLVAGCKDDASVEDIATGAKREFIDAGTTASTLNDAGISSVAADARLFTVYGPVVFERGRGKPEIQTDQFDVYNPQADYFIRIQNGDADPSTRERISSGVLVLNGEVIIGPDSFNQQVHEIIAPVTLNQLNSLEVALASKPHAWIGVEVLGIDTDLPTITADVSPEPNAYGWNNTEVLVTFYCEDLTSGIASCPDPVNLTQEGEGQVVTGTAVDNAGQTAHLDVVVNLDMTPPEIALTWPPIDYFGSSIGAIEFQGTVEDPLAGAASVTIYDHNGSASGSVPSFSIERDLLTDIQSPATSRESSFTLVAEDQAGNESELLRHVNYTLAATVVPTDPARTELADGVLKAIDRALIQLAPGTTRARAHQIVESHGGRVAGYLPFANKVLAEFDTASVSELETLLDSIEQETDVIIGSAVYFMRADQFDNEALSAADAVAYSNVRLQDAVDFISNNNLLFNPVGVAILDSGINPNFGSGDELTNVLMYDLCTPEGREGNASVRQDLTGHGSRVAGVIAGANNTSGNNGILRGLAGSDFDVSMFRVHCEDDAPDQFDSALIAQAFEMIVGDTVPGIDVVNMSFSGYSEDDNTLQCMDALYDPYFNSLQGRDIMWVASAGNDGIEISCNGPLTYPAGMACLRGNVIAAGGINPSTYARNSASNYGDEVTIFAPGSNVYTAVGEGAYGGASGTSMSAAMVTGAAALLESVKPQGPLSVRNAIENSAQALVSGDTPQGGLDMYQMMLVAALPPLQLEEFSGNSGGGEEIVALSNGAKPGLRGFLFNYSDSDHHIKTVEAGYFTLSGNPDYGVLVEYSDQNGDDDYSYQVHGIQLPAGTTYHSVSGCPGVGFGINRLIGEIDPDVVPVMTAFRLYLDQGSDHEFKRMEARMMTAFGNYLYVETVFEDDSTQDDVYCYSVEYALVPSSRVRASGHISGGNATRAVTRTIDAPQPVLQGFNVEYEDGDHNVDQVGVILDEDRARIWLNDQNDDDEFSWDVWYLDLR